jgi:hypothetical protein
VRAPTNHCERTPVKLFSPHPRSRRSERASYSRQVQQRRRPRTPPTNLSPGGDLPQRPRATLLPRVRIEGAGCLAACRQRGIASADHQMERWTAGSPHYQAVPAVTHSGDRTCKRTAGPSSSRWTCPVKTARSMACSVSGGSCATARSAGKKPLGPRKLWRAQEGIPCLHSVEGRCDRGAAPAGSW